MAYEKQAWACGDVITADKLNHMEDGIAGGGMTIIECEVDFGGDVVTLTNADKLVEAGEDMKAHPEKAFSYGIIIFQRFFEESNPYYIGRGSIDRTSAGSSEYSMTFVQEDIIIAMISSVTVSLFDNEFYFYKENIGEDGTVELIANT